MGNFWWVNQGARYAWQSELNILRAPLTTSNGRTQSHWERMDSLAPGDIVFNYERGYITVDTHGLVQQGPRAPETHHPQSYINDLVGRQVTARTPRTAKHFEWHRDWHRQQLTRSSQR